MLTRALTQLIPHSAISVVSECPWHSMTFAGMLLTIEIAIAEHRLTVSVEQLSRQLELAEFDIPHRIVADIAIVDATVADGLTTIIVQILMLET
jgi:hypothetical protein